MKQLLLIKSIIMFLFVLSGSHIVSMSYGHHPTSDHNHMIAVEAEASFVFMQTDEDKKKHIDLFNSFKGMSSLVLLVAMILCLFCVLTTRTKDVRHFLCSVQYQSSYLSKNRLLNTL
ncbi:hypothetical protein [Metabacillus litoralis]|uniref:hypothetical protein n=1 Tax=Metabacillus litoralis TaxID=152268 RepID=UPI001CFE9C77|nr:hypothetical protein [Metabacillus litoralis]